MVLPNSFYSSKRDRLVYVAAPNEPAIWIAETIHRLSCDCARIVPVSMALQETAVGAVAGAHSFEWWLDFRLALVEKAEALLVLSDVGLTDAMLAEEQHARVLCKPVFNDFPSVITWANY
jgi:hypothetical protein